MSWLLTGLSSKDWSNPVFWSNVGLFRDATRSFVPQTPCTTCALSVLSSCDRLISLFCRHVLCANHLPPGNDSTAQWRVWASSSCTERGPGRIYTQNYLACPSLPPSTLPPEKERDYLSHRGGVTQMVHQMCGRSSWWESGVGAKRTSRRLVLPRCGGSRVLTCVRVCVRTRLSICIEMYLRTCAPLPRFSGISSYGRPTILLHTAGCPTLPSCHWGSPRPLGLARLGAPPPVLPGSCCPQLRSRRRYWGRTKSLLLWLCLGPLGGGEDEGVARRSSWKARGI